MATSFGALCTDFYVNHKLGLKMDLPDERETILHFCEAIRKAVPSMDRFRRHDGEVSLESSRRNQEYHWLSLQRTSIRTGHVNPPSMANSYGLHKLIIQVAPYHLSISPLDVDYFELMFGFDLECEADHDAVIFEALFDNTPLAELLKIPGGKPLEIQPILGASLSERGELQAYFEVKTRTKSRRGSDQRYKDEPISLFLTVRRYGPMDSIDAMPAVFKQITEQAETLATEKLVPNLLAPIAQQITSQNA